MTEEERAARPRSQCISLESLLSSGSAKIRARESDQDALTQADLYED